MVGHAGRPLVGQGPSGPHFRRCPRVGHSRRGGILFATESNGRKLWIPCLGVPDGDGYPCVARGMMPLTAGKATWNGRETEWLAGRSPRSAERRQEARFPMLVITRREGEEVVIGNPAAPLGIVRIAAIKGDRVRIALEFPREVEVHRREVADQILKDEDNPGIAGQIRPTGDSG